MFFNDVILNGIREKLRASEHTISIAESVTSGFIQAAFSSAKEASLFFQGGITLYNLGQKTRHLNIEPITAQLCNCVSNKVAEQMAVEVCKMFLSNYGIGITGYATRVPDMNINDLYAHIAVAYDGKVILSERIHTDKENVVDVQLDFTRQVLEKFYYIISKASTN